MNNREDSAPRPLETRLGQLSYVRPPAGLREKLVATVPHGAGGQPQSVVAPRWPRVFRYVGAAAIVVIAASVLLQFLAPAYRPPGPALDMNDSLASAAMTDQNSLLPRDMNVCDTNAVP